MLTKALRTFILLCFLFANRSSAQTFYRWTEWGVAAGASQYFGDLNDQYGFKTINPAVGVFMRYHLNHYIALRGSVNYTKVGYDDSYNDNAYQKIRNLSFKSDVVEAVLQAEFNFFRFSTGEIGSRWTPYLTGGIGAFTYSPYADYNGQKTMLRPLGTEGQNAGYSDRKYGSVAACFPIGVGVKWWVRPGLNMSFEISDRLTTTDYLDDVSTTYVGADKFTNNPNIPSAALVLQDPSVLKEPGNPLGRAGKQRGNSVTKDQYLMAQIHISIQLKTYKCPINIPPWRSF